MTTQVTRQHGKVGDVRMKEVEQERRIIKLQEEVRRYTYVPV